MLTTWSRKSVAFTYAAFGLCVIGVIGSLSRQLDLSVLGSKLFVMLGAMVALAIFLVAGGVELMLESGEKKQSRQLRRLTMTLIVVVAAVTAVTYGLAIWRNPQMALIFLKYSAPIGACLGTMIGSKTMIGA